MRRGEKHCYQQKQTQTRFKKLKLFVFWFVATERGDLWLKTTELKSGVAKLFD